MIRFIVGYHLDIDGEWVAELSCLHNQHIRHRPPFQDRAWALEEDGRRERLGSPIDCPLCTRAELPDELTLLRTLGPFDELSLPKPLHRAHRVPEHQWGLLRILEGRLQFNLETEPDAALTEVLLEQGDEQPIPPGAVHFVTTIGPCSVVLDFYGKR